MQIPILEKSEGVMPVREAATAVVDRVRHPMIGVFTLFFVYVNYDFFIRVLLTEGVENKINVLDNHFNSVDGFNFCTPAVYAVIYTLVLLVVDIIMAWGLVLKKSAITTAKNYATSLYDVEDLAKQVFSLKALNEELKDDIISKSDEVSGITGHISRIGIEIDELEGRIKTALDNSSSHFHRTTVDANLAYVFRDLKNMSQELEGNNKKIYRASEDIQQRCKVTS